MSGIDEQQFRSEYHALFDVGDPYLQVPEAIALPRTYEEFHFISCLVVQGLEHGYEALSWLRCISPEHLPELRKIRWMARDLAGLKSIVNALTRPVRDGLFNRFDVVSTETPSIHVQLLERAEEQYSSLCGIYAEFNQLGPMKASQLSAEDFYTTLFRYQLPEVWRKLDYCDQSIYSKVRAELARLEFHFDQFEPSIAVAAEKDDYDTCRPDSRITIRNELWRQMRDGDHLTTKEIVARWTRDNPMDNVSDVCVRKGITRARAEMVKKQKRDRDKL